MRMHRIILSLVACPAVQKFSTLFHKRHDFRKEILLNVNECFDFLYKVCLKHFPFSEELSDIWSQTYIGLHVKYPLLSSEFINEDWIFSTDFSKDIQISNFMKTRPVTTELFYADRQTDERTDRQTDRTKLIFAFTKFANAPKNKKILYFLRKARYLTYISKYQHILFIY
jgi:hypothetical protein